MKYVLSFFLLLVLSFTVTAKDYSYKVGNKFFEGFVLNQGKNSPLVIMIHDWDGLDGYEKKRSEMLSKIGYSVFALDMFGKGVRPSEISERKRLTGELYKNRDKMRMLMNAALSEAKKLGLNVNNATAIGYCFGGTSVLEWAKSGAPLKGFASFHGDLKVNDGDSYRNVKGKIVAYHGTADKVVSMQSFADLATLLEKEGVPHEMITYSGAPHAFTKFDSERYRKDADMKSWNLYTQFLREQSK